MKADTYQIVTDRIIAKLEAGTIPWKHFASSPLSQPQNLVSKKPYHGINYLLLTNSKFTSPYWLTYNQATELGGHVKKAEKSEVVVFWKFLEVEDKETGEKKEIPFLRYYHVFNVEQCENIEAPAGKDKAPRHSDPIKEAEMIVDSMPNRPRLQLDDVPKAYYSSVEDYVHMTRREACVSDEQYYATLFHELSHATGHKSRLNRFEEEKCDHKFGSKSYTNEELVAEVAAGFLCAEAGIFQQVEDNTAAYIASWLQRLQNDKTLVVKAAGKAQKAADYICNRTEGMPAAPSPEPGASSAETTAEPPEPAAPAQPIATPEPAEPVAKPEPQPVSEPEPGAPEPEPPTSAGQIIPGDFVGDHSVLRSIDFVAHTVTLEMLPAKLDTPKRKTQFAEGGEEYLTMDSYHGLCSDFVTVPIEGYSVDSLYAGQVLHRLVEYARPRLVGRAKISKVCFKRITAQLEAAAAAA